MLQKSESIKKRLRYDLDTKISLLFCNWESLLLTGIERIELETNGLKLEEEDGRESD